MYRFFIVFASSLFALSNSFALQNTPERWTLPNGARVVFLAADNVPMLDIRIAMPAGSAYDGTDYGLAALTTSLLDEGSGHFSGTQIAEQLADTGALFDSETTRDAALVHLKTVTQKNTLDTSIDTLARVLHEPRFQYEDVQRLKNQFLVAINARKASQDDVANDAFYETLYPHHPYAHPVYGTEHTIKMITPQKIRQFYKTQWHGEDAVLVMVGAISSEQAHTIAQKLMGTWPHGQKNKTLPLAANLKKAEQLTIPFPSSQTVIRLGQIGSTYQNPDYFPLLVGNYILGGGTLVSRLSDTVREQHGFTYGISSQLIPMPGNGPFVIGLATKNQQAQEALQLTERELKTFVEKGPTPQELKAAKDFLIGNFNVSLASNSAMAATLLKITFYHLADDYLDSYTDTIQKVTQEEIQRAFQRLIHPDTMLRVSVGH